MVQKTETLNALEQSRYDVKSFEPSVPSTVATIRSAVVSRPRSAPLSRLLASTAD
jgi:hypothetical protein